MSRRRWPTPGGWCTSCAHQPWTNSAWSPPCASRQPAWGWTARASRCRWRRRTGWTGCPPRWRWPPTGSRLRRWPMPVGTRRPVAARCAWPWRTGCASRYATTAGACPPIRLTGSGWRRCGNARPSWAAGARSRRPPTGGLASAHGFRWLLMAGERLRVLVADDHPVFRSGLRTTITAMPGVEVVGEAATGLQAVALVRQLRPDLVVMDLHMPELDGIEATRRILDHDPTVAVLVLTMLEDDDSVFAALQAGARGYLLKGADHDDITRAVQAVAQGEAIFGPAVAGRVLGLLRLRPSPHALAGPGRAHRPRAGGPGAAGRRSSQRGYRPAAISQPQDRPQLHLQHLRQAPGGLARRGHRAGTRTGTGRRHPLTLGRFRTAVPVRSGRRSLPPGHPGSAS